MIRSLVVIVLVTVTALVLANLFGKYAIVIACVGVVLCCILMPKSLPPDTTVHPKLYEHESMLRRKRM